MVCAPLGADGLLSNFSTTGGVGKHLRPAATERQREMSQSIETPFEMVASGRLWSFVG